MLFSSRFAFSRFSDFKICFIRCLSDLIGHSSISNVYNDNCGKIIVEIIKNIKIYYNVKLAILEKSQDDTTHCKPLLSIRMVKWQNHFFFSCLIYQYFIVHLLIFHFCASLLYKKSEQDRTTLKTTFCNPSLKCE